MKNKRLVLGLLFLLLIIAAMGVSAQESVPISKNYAAWAQEFLRIMYPSLNDKKYVISIDGLFAYDEPGARERWLSLSVGEGPKGQYSKIIGGWEGWTPPPKDFHFGPQYYQQFLSAGFTFDDHDRLLSYGASGIAIGNSEAEAKYDDYVTSHPGLTEGDVNVELRQAGVEYGPNDRKIFTQNLSLKVLERFLGKIDHLSVEPVPTKMSDSDVVEWVSWKVTFRATQSDGGRLLYKLFFEPFKGALTSLQAEWPPDSPEALRNKVLVTPRVNR